MSSNSGAIDTSSELLMVLEFEVRGSMIVALQPYLSLPVDEGICCE